MTLPFDVPDFLSRWKRARDVSANQDEEISLKNVFDNSRKLGLSLSKFINATLEIEDFKTILEQSDLPCFKGEWTKIEQGFSLQRSPCHEGITCGPSKCQFYREAIDGLVMGAGDCERYVRYRSFAAGDSHCEDLFLLEEKRGSPHLTIPTNILESLEEIRADFNKRFKKNVKWIGFKENEILFEFQATSSSCGVSDGVYEKQLMESVKKLYPTYQLTNCAPRAVIGEH